MKNAVMAEKINSKRFTGTPREMMVDGSDTMGWRISSIDLIKGCEVA